VVEKETWENGSLSNTTLEKERKKRRTHFCVKHQEESLVKSQSVTTWPGYCQKGVTRTPDHLRRRPERKEEGGRRVSHPGGPSRRVQPIRYL